jgi:hypothetical protein
MAWEIWILEVGGEQSVLQQLVAWGIIRESIASLTPKKKIRTNRIQILESGII